MKASSLQKLTPIRGRKLWRLVLEEYRPEVKFTEVNPDKGTEIKKTLTLWEKVRCVYRS